MKVGRVRGNTGFLGNIANFFPVASFHEDFGLNQIKSKDRLSTRKDCI
jgi:fatty acid-binding protein DegV